MSDAGFDFGYSVSAQRFIDLTTGRFVAKAHVLDLMEARIQDSMATLKDYANALINGAADVSEWQAAVATKLKNLHTQMAALGSGGWSNVTPQTWGDVGARLKAEYQYLNGFAKEIADGNLSQGQIDVRLNMYGQDAWGSFHDAQTNVMADDGFDEEKYNLEGGAKHCDGCEDRAAQGWQPIGSLPEIGAEDCGSNDRCTKSYRNSVTGREA